MTKSFQDEVQNLVNDLGSTLFCKGQDWKPGDGSAMEVEKLCIAAQSQLNTLIKDCLPKENTSELKNGAFISGYNQAIADVRKALGINDV